MKFPFYLTDPSPGYYLTTPWVVLDLETTNLDRGSPRNVNNRVIKWCINGTVMSEDTAITVLANQGPIVLVCHNAKFELGWLMRYGIDVSQMLPFDTMLAEYVLNGNQTTALGLGEVAKRHGEPGKDPVVDRMIKSGVCPSEIPEHWLEERVKYDVSTTTKVAGKQLMLLDARGLLPVFFTRCITTPVLAAIEAEGMQLDADTTRAAHDRAIAERAMMQEALDKITGGINLRSVKQKAAYLYDTLGFEELKDRQGNPKRTGSGGRMTDSTTIGALKAKTAEQKNFVALQSQFAKADAMLSKTLDCFMAAVRVQDGILYGQFNQAVTQTHRLSASAVRVDDKGAQFHNMPRVFKTLFTSATPGHVITEVDYRMLEFITAVNLARDEQGKRDIESGHDVHKFTASVLYNVAYESVTPAQRQKAKASTFKPLYGGMSGTEKEKAYFAQFRARYPQIDAMQTKWRQQVLEFGELRIASGLVFYWPDTTMTPSGYITNTPSIFNYPVQSFATADIVPAGVVYLYWRLKVARCGTRIINTIHDSVVLDGPSSELHALEGAVRRALLDDVEEYLRRVYGFELYVKNSCELLTAPHWNDKDNAVHKADIRQEV